MPGKVYTVEEIKRIVEPVARGYGVSKLSLFGSYARGEAMPDSDIDLRLVDRGAIRGLFRLSGFQLELQSRLGVKVDVLDCGLSATDFLAEIAKDEIIVYEQRQA
jgi:predicted nucleotidyltransferase